MPIVMLTVKSEIKRPHHRDAGRRGRLHHEAVHEAAPARDGRAAPRGRARARGRLPAEGSRGRRGRATCSSTRSRASRRSRSSSTRSASGSSSTRRSASSSWTSRTTPTSRTSTAGRSSTTSCGRRRAALKRTSRRRSSRPRTSSRMQPALGLGVLRLPLGAARPPGRRDPRAASSARRGRSRSRCGATLSEKFRNRIQRKIGLYVGVREAPLQPAGPPRAARLPRRSARRSRMASYEGRGARGAPAGAVQGRPRPPARSRPSTSRSSTSRTGRSFAHEALSRGPADSPFENPEVLFDYALKSDQVWSLEKICMQFAAERFRGKRPRACSS